MQIFYELTIKTKGQGLYDFTKETIDWVKKQKTNPRNLARTLFVRTSIRKSEQNDLLSFNG